MIHRSSSSRCIVAFLLLLLLVKKWERVVVGCNVTPDTPPVLLFHLQCYYFTESHNAPVSDLLEHHKVHLLMVILLK